MLQQQKRSQFLINSSNTTGASFKAQCYEFNYMLSTFMKVDDLGVVTVAHLDSTKLREPSDRNWEVFPKQVYITLVHKDYHIFHLHTHLYDEIDRVSLKWLSGKHQPLHTTLPWDSSLAKNKYTTVPLQSCTRLSEIYSMGTGQSRTKSGTSS